MKRLVSAILLSAISFAMIMSLGACSDNEPQASETTSENTTVVATTAPPTTATEPFTEYPLSYFDETAFVGDSISVSLEYYCSSTDALSNAQFFASTSLSPANALWGVTADSCHPSYNGVKALVEDCVAQSGAKRVYIMLGINQLSGGVQSTVSDYEELAGRIIDKSPGIEIVIQSITPMTADSPRADANLNNTVIKDYNKALREMAKRNGWKFIDVASAMYDSTGESFKYEYCSDPDYMGIHFSTTGCEAWAEYLRTHQPE